MKSLRLGQDVVLSWPSGAADCRVIASAGGFVLLRPERVNDLQDGIPGPCTLTFLDGMIPMGWDGQIEFGAEAGELRFRLDNPASGAERRSSVRLPVFVEVMVATGDSELRGQMLDLSAGGMRFRGTGRHEVGSLVRVFTQLPNGPALDAHGSVRMSDPGGVVAIEFTAFHVGSAQEIGAWTVGQLRLALARV